LASKGEVGGFTDKLVGFLARYAEPISVLLLIAILAVGVYLRVLPALNYGLELDANDPWIAYWEAKYFLENGLFNFEGLQNVEEFWWPTGRDILHGDYIGLAWLAAATYPIAEAFGLTLKEWIALFPVFAGAASIVLAYVLVRIVTGSRLGGLVAATLFAVLPGSIIRTKAGFVEKTGFSSPFLSAFYIFLFLAIKHGTTRKGLVYGVLAGVFGGVIAFLWGGYHLVTLSIALLPLLEPLFTRPSQDRLRLYTVIALSYILVALASPKVSISYFLANIGAGVPAALAIYALEANAEKIPLLSRIITPTPRFQLWLLTVIVVAAGIAVYSQAIGTSNRLLAVVGIRQLSPLVESVQENQPASLKSIFTSYGVALVLALMGLAAFLADVLRGKRDPGHALPRALIYAMLIFMVYANKQLAYFTQMAAYYATVAAGIGAADIARGALARPSKGKKRREATGDPLRLLAAGFVVAVVAVSAAYYASISYNTMKYSAPQILTSGLGALSIVDPNTGERSVVVPLNNAWLNALEWIKNNTAEDALIVSWWDYGYWITVNTGRKTIADGSTFNETQIRFLARVLTGTEGEASYILRNVFQAEPNNTYVVFYEIFRGVIDTQNNFAFFYPSPTITQIDNQGRIFFVAHGQADFQKSAQMLRIAYKVDPFGSVLNSNYTTITADTMGRKYYHFPGLVGEPQENVELVRNTLLYKMAINGIAALPQTALVDASTCGNILDNTTAAIMGAVVSSMGGTFQFEYILPGQMQFFTPVAASISCPIVSQQPNGYNVVAVIVFIYQWTG